MANAPITPIWAADKDSNLGGGFDPKRSNRFILYLDGVPSYFVKSHGTIAFVVADAAKHVFLGHTFKFPGSVTWTGTIDLVLVDTIDINMAEKFVEYIRKAGYVYPSNFSESASNPEYFKKTISKSKFPFKGVKLQRIDADGTTYENWALKGPWINKVDFGAGDYAVEGLLNITVGISYDWAEMHKGDLDSTPSFPA